MNYNKVKCRRIEDWADGFKKLYAKQDAKRTPEEFWNATMAHISGIGEAIRRVHYRELLRSAAHAFCWMTCYVRKCNETEDELFNFENNFSEIVGLKYPKKCGHCEYSFCQCDPIKMDKAKEKSAKYTSLFIEWKDIKFETFTIGDWLRIFWKIYSGKIHLLTLESIGFHLLEEAGEEAKAVRQLVQFRGISAAGIKGIDADYLKKISNIHGLVVEYSRVMEILKKYYKTKSEKEALKRIDFRDSNPKVLIARLVKGKMDFAIELADTFSWFCAVMLKLLGIIENEKLEDDIVETFHIEKELRNLYDSPNETQVLTCYACKQTDCECLFYPEFED